MNEPKADDKKSTDLIYSKMLILFLKTIDKWKRGIKIAVFLFFACSVIAIILQCLGLDVLHLPFIQDINNRILQAHEVVHESISMMSIAISVIVAGLSIAATLYLSLWDSLSSSLYNLHLQVDDKSNSLTKDQKIPAQKADFLQEMVKANILHFSEAVKHARSTFGIALFIAALDMILLFSVIFIRDQSLSHIVFYVATVMSIVLSLFFFLGVYYLQSLGPVRAKLNIQRGLILIKSTQKADVKQWEDTMKELLFDLTKKGFKYNLEENKIEPDC